MFQELTRETFSAPTKWPSPQLSSLSTGMPVELSLAAGPDAVSGLRYACEVGNVLLPTGARAASAVAAVRRSAASLGYDEAWDRISPAVAVTADPALPVPDSCRFRVWGGLDQPAGGPPALKVYLSLLHAGLGRARRLLDATLERAGLPVSAELAEMLDLLDAAGFAHEVGFGLGPDGRIAVKVYHELEGWRPVLARDLLLWPGCRRARNCWCPSCPACSASLSPPAAGPGSHCGSTLSTVGPRADHGDGVPAAAGRQRRDEAPGGGVDRRQRLAQRLRRRVRPAGAGHHRRGG